MAVCCLRLKTLRVAADFAVDEEPSAILDLTCLLVTGRASDSLVDFLGSGEQMSERVSLSPRRFYILTYFYRASRSGKAP